MPSSPSKFSFLAEDRCLDFINTQVMEGDNLVDLLEDFHDLLTWMTEAELVSKEEARDAAKRWAGRRMGEVILRRAQAFRGALRKMVQGITQGKSVSRTTVSRINSVLRSRLGYPQLVNSRGRFETRNRYEFDPPVGLLAPIAKAASRLLSSGEFFRVKCCENPHCPLCFYDTTDDASRRWCNGGSCGGHSRGLAVRQRPSPTGAPAAAVLETSTRETVTRGVPMVVPVRRVAQKKKVAKKKTKTRVAKKTTAKRTAKKVAAKKSPKKKTKTRVAKKKVVKKVARKKVTPRRATQRKVARKNTSKKMATKKIPTKKKVSAKRATRKKTGKKKATSFARKRTVLRK